MVEFKEVRQGLALLEGDQGQEDVAGERQIERSGGFAMAVPVFLPGAGVAFVVVGLCKEICVNVFSVWFLFSVLVISGALDSELKLAGGRPVSRQLAPLCGRTIEAFRGHGRLNWVEASGPQIQWRSGSVLRSSWESASSTFY